ncbi:coiled-coil domain-containing protein 93-like protein [Dinothrombium tinctorium]|uniref:Coiled-coil domain-containing protein 93 n=1 Tax=Dinothrombium tinctorium TaxID=1965070 RepID=A0A3S3SMN9_9ACAR|nr:coiled-coil domain-containing protein 93-like protein [Dinothrombium tinctorium]
MSTVAAKPVPKPKPRAASKPTAVESGVGHIFESRSNKGGDERNTDSFGNYLKTDVRENEEQFEKLSEIIDILVAAGYFRARIKGLSDFDKVVGGMCWCLEMSNIDIDCDLLFNDTLTIGQKIALTEKIVRVLQAMKCPFRLEPHQIQGMDCIHIFPVIQWLVKKTIQFREEMQAYIKLYSVTQFNKNHIDLNLENRKMENMIETTDVYNNPKRKYRHPKKYKINDEKMNVRTTLLEYGAGLMSELKSEASESSNSEDKETAVKSEEPKTIIREMNVENSFRVSAAVIGSIISDKAEEIQVLAEEYAKRQKEMMENSLEMREKTIKSKILETKKAIESAEKQKVVNERDIIKLSDEIEALKSEQSKVSPKIKTQSEEEIEKRKKFILIHDSLQSQKEEYIDFCNQEKIRLQNELKQISKQEVESEDENEIKAEVEREKEKHRKVKLLLAERNKAVAIMQRKLDDIPSRAELSQYQKRFYELYNQVSAKHNETKKFYILYNQLDDTKIHLNKELNLLNSILTNFNQAANNPTIREQFLSQFEQIVGNIKQAKLQIEKRKQMEKMKKDQLNEQYVDLVEKQRLYYKAVKEFTEECRKNEQLIVELQKLSK